MSISVTESETLKEQQRGDSVPRKGTVQKELAGNSPNLNRLVHAVAEDAELLQEIFDGLAADKARVKFGCLKLLRILSETKPEVLYPEIDRLFDLLDAENKIFQWGAILCIGNLAAVDSKRKIDRKLDRFLRPIRGNVMITAANVVRASGQIARAKPYLADKIAAAVIQAESATYQTAECRNVVLGHAIESLGLFFRQIKRPQPIIEFVRRQVHNPRNAVRRKAARFLKKHSGTSIVEKINRQ